MEAVLTGREILNESSLVDSLQSKVCIKYDTFVIIWSFF